MIGYRLKFWRYSFESWLNYQIETRLQQDSFLGHAMHAVFNPRSRSLLRGNLLVIASLIVALLLSHPPQMRPTLFLLLPLLGVLWGTVDTARCMQRRWGFYHGGVVLCVYMDLMTITMIAFFLIYPYMLWFVNTR